MCDFATKTAKGLYRHTRNIHSEKGVQRRKKKESFVVAQLLSHGLSVQHDCEVLINLSCVTDLHRFVRLDAFVPRESHECIVEIDEDQHKTRMLSCENRRMNDATGAIRSQGNERPIVWVRYNPDAFRINGVLQKLPRKERIAILVNVIRSYVPSSDMEILYLFYDTSGEGIPLICVDPDYDHALKPCVRIRNSDGTIVGIPLSSAMESKGTDEQDGYKSHNHNNTESKHQWYKQEDGDENKQTNGYDAEKRQIDEEQKTKENGRYKKQQKQTPKIQTKYNLGRDDKRSGDDKNCDARPTSKSMNSLLRRWLPIDFDDDIIIRKNTFKCR